MAKNKMRPIHPGEILREEYMLPLGLSANALARALGVTAARINDIVRGRAPLSGMSRTLVTFPTGDPAPRKDS